MKSEMRRWFLLLCAVLGLVACSGQFDDSEIQQQLQDHENRIAQLEKACKEMNTNLTALQAFVDALQKEDVVTGIVPIKQEEEIVGYTVTFLKGEPVTIHLGTAHTPQISVKKDTDGTYYWYLDGNWLLDEEGHKVKAQGGEDGLTPELKIEGGFWYVRYGAGEWTKLGAATAEGNAGDSLFKEVQIGTDEVTFVLADGETLVLPLKNVRLVIHFADQTVGILPGQTLKVDYTIEGAAEGTLVKALAQNGWKVKVHPTSFDAGELVVTAPDPMENDEILVFVSDGRSCTIMTAVDFVKGTVRSAVEKMELTAAAGTFSLTVESNLEYVVEVPEADQIWLQPLMTKSMKEEVLNFSYQENKGAARSSQIVLKNVKGEVMLTVPVAQKAASETPVPPVGEKKWTRVIRESDLMAGDVIRLACSPKGKVCSAQLERGHFVSADAVFSGNQMEDGEALDLTLEGTPGAWVLATAQGKLVANGVKDVVYGENPTLWKIQFEEDGAADLRCNYGCMMYNSSAPRFTVYNTGASNQMHKVEIYKKIEDAVIGNGQHPEIQFGKTTVAEVAKDGARFSQQYNQASTVPEKVGFHFTTDPDGFNKNVFDYVEAPKVQNQAGEFSQFVSSLKPNTTYYVRAYAKVYGTGDFSAENKTLLSSVVSFKTLSDGSQPVDPQVPQEGKNIHGHLTNYEIPYAEVNIPAGHQYSSTVSERGGGSNAYIYETQAEGQRIVTHTFQKGNDVCRNYTFLYDYEKKLPLWLAYHMNRGYCGSGGNRTNAWGYDPAVPQQHQPNLSSSYGSGYNRGHMLASHARSAITEANRQAFYYTNMTPQDERNLNTGGCSWNELEDHEMSILPSGRDTLYVVTGCTFDTPVKYITSKKGDRCAVPKECYKCFMMCSFDTNGKMISAKGIGYLMPNNKDGRNPYSQFARTIDEIEAITGFNFFANVPDDLQNAAESKKTVL